MTRVPMLAAALFAVACLHDLPSATVDGGVDATGTDTLGTDTPRDQNTDRNIRDTPMVDSEDDGGVEPPTELALQLPNTTILAGVAKNSGAEFIVGNTSDSAQIVVLPTEGEPAFYSTASGDLYNDVAVNEIGGVIVGRSGNNAAVIEIDRTGLGAPEFFVESGHTTEFMACDANVQGWVAVGSRNDSEGIVVGRLGSRQGVNLPGVLLTAVAITGVDSSTGIYIAGQISSGMGAAFIAKWNFGSPVLQWQKSLTVGTSAQITHLVPSDGGIIAAGTSNGDPFLVEFADNGVMAEFTLLEPTGTGATLRSSATSGDQVWFSGSEGAGNGSLVASGSTNRLRTFGGLGASFLVGDMDALVMFSTVGDQLIRQPLTPQGEGACASTTLDNAVTREMFLGDTALVFTAWLDGGVTAPLTWESTGLPVAASECSP